MNHREQLRPLAFDEQRALEELQNLKREIQRARTERERAEAEFDAFLRGFHDEPGTKDVERRVPPRPTPAVEQPSQPPRVEQPQPARIDQPPPPPPPTRIEQPEPSRVEQPQPPQPPVAPPPAPRPAPEPAPRSEPSAFESAPPLLPPALEPELPAPSAFGQPPPIAFQHAPFDTDADTLPPPVVSDVPPLLVRPKRRQSVGAWAAISIALIVLVAFVVMFRGEDTDPASPTATLPPAVTTPETPPADAPAAPSPAASAPAQTAPQPGVNLEMVTTRPVWVRVTIDGRRAIERELPAGERIPLQGERSILIRAGDAGAVTVTRDGRDLGVLGEDAMPATREFKNTAPPATRQ